MGLVSAIVALCKAVPILERLFLGVADAVREANAKAMFNAKLDHIDAAMRNASSIGGVLHTTKNEWSEDPDRSPTVPEGSAIRACVD